MADTDGCNSELGGCSTPSCKDGPVLTMMNKRLRALKKKYNRILQIEDGKSQGKSINKEQEEVLKTKIAVAALIDEYEKLRQPLLVAVKEELAEREKELMDATLRREEEEESAVDEKELEANLGSRKEARSDEVRENLGMEAPAECNGSWNAEEFAATGVDSIHSEDAEDVKVQIENAQLQVATAVVADDGFDGHLADGHIAELLKLLYFAQLFDVNSQREAPSLMWTKVHERSSCLSYDFVTEDSTSPLLDHDLDALSLFGSLVTSRPPNATLSHRDALHQCIQHAILWLQNSDRPIRTDVSLTYSHLRERLNRILCSEYFTMTPELQTVSQQTAVAVATAAGQYASQMLLHEPSGGAGIDPASIYVSYQDPVTAHQVLLQTGQHYIPTPLEVNNGLETSDGLLTVNSTAPSDNTADEGAQVGSQADADKMMADNTSSVPEVHHIPEIDHSTQALELEEPQQLQEQQKQQSFVSNVSVGPRGLQGPKGGGRGLVHGPGSRGRGYTNGRGRSARGGYANGRNGQYYDQTGYYPRNYYGRGGGRGARGGGSMNNGYVNGQPTSVTAKM